MKKVDQTNIDLTKLFNKKFIVTGFQISEGSNFVNIRHDQTDIARANKYALKTKSVRIKKQTV